MTKAKAEPTTSPAITPDVIEPTLVSAPDQTTPTDTAEMVMHSLNEFNAIAYTNGASVVSKMYEHYLTNVQAMFADLKALTNAADAKDFYCISANNNAVITERMLNQYQIMNELSEHAAVNTKQASFAAYAKVFPATH